MEVTNDDRKNFIQLPPLEIMVREDDVIFVNFESMIAVLEKFSETGDIAGAVKMMKSYHSDISDKVSERGSCGCSCEGEECDEECDEKCSEECEDKCPNEQVH